MLVWIDVQFPWKSDLLGLAEYLMKLYLQIKCSCFYNWNSLSVLNLLSVAPRNMQSFTFNLGQLLRLQSTITELNAFSLALGQSTVQISSQQKAGFSAVQLFKILNSHKSNQKRNFVEIKIHQLKNVFPCRDFRGWGKSINYSFTHSQRYTTVWTKCKFGWDKFKLIT